MLFLKGRWHMHPKNEVNNRMCLSDYAFSPVSQWSSSGDLACKLYLTWYPSQYKYGGS